MSDESKVITGMEVANANLIFSQKQKASSYDMAGNHKFSCVQDLSTVMEPLEISDALISGTPGWSVFHNLSDVITIEVGVETISSMEIGVFLHLEPGEVCVCPIQNVNIWAHAIGGTAQLDYTILER